MAVLNQVEVTHSMEVSDATRDFLYTNCPKRGTMSYEELYYINSTVMDDLKEIAKVYNLDLPDLAKIEAFVNQVGLYEFMLEV